MAKEGEKGVSGVPGPLVPPEVRLKVWRWDVGAGDWTEEEPDLRDALDCDVDSDGFAVLEARSFLENRPIVPGRLGSGHSWQAAMESGCQR